MKLIDDLKAAAKLSLEKAGATQSYYEERCTVYRFDLQTMFDETLVLLLCEAVEALDGVVEQDFWDFLDADGREVEARDRASAVLDKIRSYAP